MGVPGLYKWLTTKFGNIRTKLIKDLDYDVDCLYLDFNAIIHPNTPKELADINVINSTLHKNLFKYVDNLISFAKPKKLIYISIDGVAPMAKIQQQKARRFESGKENLRDKVVYSGYIEGRDVEIRDPNSYKRTFDSNAITPGTKFMEALDKFLRYFIMYKKSTSSPEEDIWKNCTVIYSNYLVPGEGEQKIMEYLRVNQVPKSSDPKKNLNHVIFSPDADLVFLGLTLPTYNIRIMRETYKPKRSHHFHKHNNSSGNSSDNFSTTSEKDDEVEYEVLNISKLKSSIIDVLTEGECIKLDEGKFIRDFVFLCFTVGDDFLPNAPAFEIRSNALDKLISLYKNFYKKINEYITNDDSSVNFNALISFFKECSIHEDKYLKEKRINLIHSRKRMDLPFNDKEEFLLTTKDGRLRYYKEKMGVDNEEELLKSCLEYVKGMCWVYKYYFFKCPSWKYFYPYHFVPFASDLSLLHKIDVSFDGAKPVTPFEQLLLALPSTSMRLVPEPLRKYYFENNHLELKVDSSLIKDLKSPDFIRQCNSCSDKELNLFDIFRFKDLEFKTDDFQKIMEYQAVPILPNVDILNINEFHQREINNLEFKDLERNRNDSQNLILFISGSENIKKYSNISKSSYNYFTDENVYMGKVYPLPNSDNPGAMLDEYGFTFKNLTMELSFDQKVRQVQKKKVL